ncbi:MAG: hypothetical protein GY810_31755 [Aureispira sp.]|nr:hypothetical protein [Aureispira sp.]
MQNQKHYLFSVLAFLLFSFSNSIYAQTGTSPSLEMDDDMALSESVKDFVVYTDNTSKQVELTYSLPKAEKLVLKIVNDDRKVVYTETIAASKAGNQRKLVDVQKYKSGTYFFQLSSGGHTYTQVATLKN